MSLSRLEPSTSGKRWVSVANWATSVGYYQIILKHEVIENRKEIAIYVTF
ncbi:hypothetical protein Hanom_Chr16g01518751 [Helianthus anomalus]